jgi:hypothetical protein
MQRVIHALFAVTSLLCCAPAVATPVSTDWFRITELYLQVVS